MTTTAETGATAPAPLTHAVSASGPVSQVHTGDGGGARRRQAQAMGDLLAMDGDILMEEVEADKAMRPEFSLVNIGSVAGMSDADFGEVIGDWHSAGPRRPSGPMDNFAEASDEPDDALSSGSAAQVHAGTGTAAQGAASGREMLSVHQTAEPSPYYAIVPLDGQMREINLPLEACLSVVNHAHAALWDEAVALAAKAGPMPLVSEESWAEGDCGLKSRLLKHGVYTAEELAVDVGSQVLSAAAEHHGLPRARLVLVEG